MRTIIDIPDDLLAKLGEACADEGVSRSEYVRRAVRRELEARIAPKAKAFGLWKKHGKPVDGLAYERKLRREWTSKA
jgi:Arc/MetJ-type ribon-helix-helix transcriptional regulator